MLRNTHFLAALYFPYFPYQVIIENSNIPFKHHILIYLLNIIVMFFFHRLVCLIILLNTFFTELLRLFIILFLYLSTSFQVFFDNISCNQIFFQVDIIHDETFLKWILFIVVFIDFYFHLFFNIFKELVHIDFFPRQSIFFLDRQHFLLLFTKSTYSKSLNNGLILGLLGNANYFLCKILFKSDMFCGFSL